MTLSDAQAKRDDLLTQLGLTETRKGDRAVSFSSGDARLKELAFLDNLIANLSAQQAGTASAPRTTYASFSRD